MTGSTLPSYPVPPTPVINTPPQASVAVPPQTLPPQQTPYLVPPTPVINTPPQASVAVPPQTLPPQQTPYLVPPTPVINTPPQASVAVAPQVLPQQSTPQPRPLTVAQPLATQIPGNVNSRQVGHAAIFQHAHAVTPATASRASGSGESKAVFLPPQVTHGVITPGMGVVTDARIAQPRSVALYCLLPTTRPDGSTFGGLLEPPPGWEPAQTVTSAHVSLQGGANYLDPVLRALPANHPPHAVCLVDLVVYQ